MVIQSYINNLIKNKNGIKALFFIRVLLGNRYLEHLNTPGLDVNNFTIIKDTLNYLLERRDYRDEEYLFSAMDVTERNVLPESDFSWFFNDENACAFIWGVLFNSGDNSGFYRRYAFDIDRAASGFYLSKYNDDVLKNWFELLRIEPVQLSHIDRFKAITYFFNCAVFQRNTKKMLMDEIKAQWNEESQNVKEMTWLSDGGRDAAIWTWEYLKKYNDKERGEQSYGGINTLELFNPSGEGELPLVIYAVLRSWHFRHHSERKMLLLDMKKAWRQRAYRKGRNNIKILNCELDIDVKNHLDELAQAYNKSIVDMVTELIEKEYHGRK
ncbi:hypothetical protein ACW2AL_04545 [Providencia sp. PROV170]|nr:hypothetical protein [Providencia rettgeri]ELR5155991.1 hypothetical protein [Providencia rettgeri]HEC8343287.1 hypothetical protein [Providencia rettgeri]